MLCDKVCQWLATGRWFSQGTAVSQTNTTVESDVKHHKPTNQTFINKIVSLALNGINKIFNGR
jgi:hypothetical protein